MSAAELWIPKSPLDVVGEENKMSEITQAPQVPYGRVPTYFLTITETEVVGDVEEDE